MVLSAVCLSRRINSQDKGTAGQTLVLEKRSQVREFVRFESCFLVP